jgi:alpha-L-fucosidase
MSARPSDAAKSDAMKRIIATCCLGLLLEPLLVSPLAAEEKRMDWWSEARFGMFIHWGPDAIPSLHWAGKPWNTGPTILYPAHESILHIPRDEWREEVIEKFNPVDYDAESWVKTAKRAGMKYVVITTKHHNGFCMWPGLEGYDIRSTPFKRDPIGELVAACRKHDMRIGFYFSQLDWHDPDAVGDHKPVTYPEGWIVNPDVFLPRMHAQIRDLLTRYGRIDVLWFDGDWIGDWTAERGRALEAEIRRIQPDIVINDRVGKRAPGDGDFSTPEQEIPAGTIVDKPWETCMTMNDTWFYVKQDRNWKPAKTLIRNLIDIASKGGNFLLNVGPDARGVIPEDSVERLDAIGGWLSTNGESVYGTQASPFPNAFDWGRCTMKTLPDGRMRLYLHVFERPEDGKLVIPQPGDGIHRAYRLSDPEQTLLPFVREGDSMIITLPDMPADPNADVVVLDLEGKPEIATPAP